MAATVLLVDDSDAGRASMRRALEDAELDVTILEAQDGAQALGLALGGQVDVVLSDVVMPKLDGIQLLRAIRQQKEPEALPVILITSRSDEGTRAASYESGVSDYLTKPFLPLELVSRVQVQLRLLGLQSELKRATERFRVLGAHDELTGLANRRHFFDLCRRELARSRRHSFSMSLAVLDIDGFREVNTRVGYLVGDAIINDVSVLLSRHLRGTDVLARLGGEKFGVMLPQTDLALARGVAARLCEAVRAHTFPQQQSGVLSVSVGSATFPTVGIESVDDLINAAEASLDRAKERGGARVEVWDAAGET